LYSSVAHVSRDARWYRQKEDGQQVVSADYAAAAIRGQSESLLELADVGQRPY
jgi:hypothetical protein